MRIPVLVLAVSLAANAASFVALTFKPSLAPPLMREFFQRIGGNPATASRSPAKSPGSKAMPAKADPRSWPALASDDLPTLVAHLRAAGFSPMMIRAIVSAQIEARFRGRMNALVGTVADTPFWKPEPTSSLNNPKFYEEYSQIYRERARMLRQLLGDDALADASGEATAAQRRQFGDMPKNKIELVQRIVEDYAEMTAQVRSSTQGITLPEDREKLALLDREKRADLAAVLTPEELESYEMRTSTITSRLRTALTLMDASDEEFRTIFRVQQSLADALYPQGGTYGADMARQRTDAQKKVADDLKAALGEERFAEYTRASNYEYQQLVRIGEREGISQAALVSAYGLRDSVTKESTRIYEDKQLDNDAKRAALLTLGQTTKAKIIATLGPTAGNAYIESASWVSAPERGWIVRMGPDGQMNSFSGLPPPSTARPTN